VATPGDTATILADPAAAAWRHKLFDWCSVRSDHVNVSGNSIYGSRVVASDNMSGVSNVLWIFRDQQERQQKLSLHQHNSDLLSWRLYIILVKTDYFLQVAPVIVV